VVVVGGGMHATLRLTESLENAVVIRIGACAPRGSCETLPDYLGRVFTGVDCYVPGALGRVLVGRCGFGTSCCTPTPGIFEVYVPFADLLPHAPGAPLTFVLRPRVPCACDLPELPDVLRGIVRSFVGCCTVHHIGVV
jgi:hypothetical protein